jgi:hypothetical protein
MKREEQVVSEFLTKRFGKVPAYEPLGKCTPPDFSIDDTAFEVRRLNQRYLNDGDADEGLEQIDIPLNLALHSELSKIPSSERGGTIFWGSRFKRPLEEKIGSIVKQLGEGARQYYERGSRKPKEITVGSVTLDLFASDTSTGKAFRMGYTSDYDSGGMLGDIYPTSIRMALRDKIAKTKDITDRFSRWVLVLVDDVLPGMMEPNDVGPLNLNLEHFHSVVVVNPVGASLALEYPYGSLKLHEGIRQRAYELYERRGREHGHDLDDWLKAEAQPGS